MMKSENFKNFTSNSSQCCSPNPKKKNKLEEANIVTKENIFACNLKFSNLFLNKADNQENDKDFIDHFEQLKNDTQESSIMTTQTTHFTDNKNNIQTKEVKKNIKQKMENKLNNDIASGSNSETDEINYDLLKLMDSPNNSNKYNKDESPLKGKKIIIADSSTYSSLNNNPSKKKHSPSKLFTNFNTCYPMNHQIPDMSQSMVIPNTFMVPFHPGIIPFQQYNNFYLNNNYVNVNSFGIINPNNRVAPMPEKRFFNNEALLDKTSSSTSIRDYKTSTSTLFQRYSEMTENELILNSKELSKDQGGCRFLQKLLENSPDFSTLLYNRLKSDFIELTNDSFGNYLIQKLIEKLPSNLIDTIIDELSPNMLNIGINPHGTRVLQKLIEIVKVGDQLDKFIKSFKGCVISFCNDINGNHIIQKFITTIGSPKNQFIFELIQKNIILIGLNKHGCCALQKCIEFGTEKQRTDMINYSIKHSRMFLTDKYGNYVLQNIISYQNNIAIKVITDSFLKDIFKLSKEKFSSNVIEKCMDYCDEETKNKILLKLANKDYLPELLMNMYGNYVIQKALQIADEPYYSIFIENIGPLLGKLKSLSFGAKLYTKFINNYSEFADYVNKSSYFDEYEYKDNKDNLYYYKK